MQGGGKGGKRINMGTHSRQNCIDLCLLRKRTNDDSINGVTVYTKFTTENCYCERFMKSRYWGQKYLRSCLLKIPGMWLIVYDLFLLFSLDFSLERSILLFQY